LFDLDANTFDNNNPGKQHDVTYFGKFFCSKVSLSAGAMFQIHPITRHLIQEHVFNRS
jgi:hypothetical protein